MHCKAVLFDMDGVILDSEPLHYEAAKATLAAHRCSLAYDDYKKYFGGQTDKAGFARYGAVIGRPAAEIAVMLAEKAQTYQRLAASAKLIPCSGTIEYIHWLASRQMPMALVTGSLRKEAELVLRTFKLQHSFAAVIAAEDVMQGKPHPEGYLKGADSLGVEPGACVVIEDAPSGIEAARTAGMQCIALTTTYAADELKRAHAVVECLQAGKIILG